MKYTRATLLFAALALGAVPTVGIATYAVGQVTYAMAYLPSNPVDYARVLPPPPVAGSAADKADRQAVLAAQKQQGTARGAVAVADVKVEPNRIASALGTTLNRALTPRTILLMNRLRHDTRRLSDESKDHWKRPRPYQVIPGLVLAAPKPGTPVKPSWAYPSGHAIWGMATALTLAELVPEKRAALLQRARDFGQSRVIVGVHWPSDVAAGAKAGELLFQALKNDPGFQRDLAAARTELRQRLHLPAK